MEDVPERAENRTPIRRGPVLTLRTRKVFEAKSLDATPAPSVAFPRGEKGSTVEAPTNRHGYNDLRKKSKLDRKKLGEITGGVDLPIARTKEPLNSRII